MPVSVKSAVSRWPCRNGRVLRREILSHAADDDRAWNLRDLASIHHWLGGRRVLTRLLDELVEKDTSFSLLDVGSASSGAGTTVRRRFRQCRVVSVDIRHPHLASASGHRVVGDAFRLPFSERSFDFVICSLLMHEYPDPQIRRLLGNLHNIADKALIILDLHRHPVPYHFLPLTRWLFGWGDVTLHDGQASVEAAFTPGELAALASDAGLREFSVSRHFPWFRLSLVAKRS